MYITFKDPTILNREIAGDNQILTLQTANGERSFSREIPKEVCDSPLREN